MVCESSGIYGFLSPSGVLITMAVSNIVLADSDVFVSEGFGEVIAFSISLLDLGHHRTRCRL